MAELKMTVCLDADGAALVQGLIEKVEGLNQRLEVFMECLNYVNTQFPVPAPEKAEEAPAAPAPAQPAPVPAQVSKDEVMRAVRELCKQGVETKERVASIVARYCAEGQKASVSNIDPARYAELLADLEGAFNG